MISYHVRSQIDLVQIRIDSFKHFVVYIPTVICFTISDSNIIFFVFLNIKRVVHVFTNKK